MDKKITKPKRLRTCNFCRKNHLKCDSKQPCTNCSIRKIECVYSLRKQRISPRELQLEKELALLKAEYSALQNEKKQVTPTEEVNKFSVMSNLYNMLQHSHLLLHDVPQKVYKLPTTDYDIVDDSKFTRKCVCNSEWKCSSS
jgi:hypothetical protein